MRPPLGLAAIALAMLTPALGLGQPSSGGSPARLGLRWLDPAALAPDSQAEFEARLTERLGRPAFEPQGSVEQVLVVSWEGSPEQCRVHLELLHGARVEGTRSIQSPTSDCKSLGSALLTVSALLIESVQAKPPDEPAPEPAPSPPPAVAPVPAPRVSPAVRSDAALALLLSLGAEVGAGMAPRLEVGPSAALVLIPTHHLRVGAAFTYFLPQTDGARPGFELAHASVGLLACGMPLSGSFGLGLCARGGVHRFAVTGLALPQTESSRALSGSAGLSMRAEWRLARHFWWVADAGGDLLTRPLYLYFQPASGGETRVFSQGRVSPRASVGLTLELP